jgi:prepilin peptidase CpaA
MVPALCAGAVSLVACATDLTRRRIPNWLTLGGAVAAIAYQSVVGGWAGAGQSLAGWGVGLLLFLPMFALRGMGGGDVKLLAALGAWLGPMLVFWLALWATLVGGVLGLVVALRSRYLQQALSNVWGLLMFWRVMGPRPHPGVTLESAPGPRLPYSLPIAAALGITLWLH